MTAIFTEPDQEMMLNLQTEIRPTGQVISLPPLYTWPASLKRLILVAGIAVCLGAYGLFISGIIGIVILLLQFV
jgi:hypothetical protein